jgi:D-3-phosphoglycerate dehydrogenase
MSHIFIALSTFSEFDKAPLELLKGSGIPFSIHATGKRITKEELLTTAKHATVIVAGVEPYDEDVFSGLSVLQCIVRCGVGVDAIDLEAARKKNVTVLNTPHIPALAVAELALAMYLSLSRNLRPQANSMGLKKWERFPSHLLSHKTIGIIGFGKIGRKIAELLAPFQVRLMVCDPFIDEDIVREFDAVAVDKDTILRSSDIVSVHASKTKNGSVILGRDEYAIMKKGALLVNLSRGGIIDEEALIEALDSGHLGGAGLDVFAQEPYTGRLCEFENVVLTPHSATLPVETRTAMELECIDKALRFLRFQIREEEKVI